jgi:hypothetical protein
MRKYHVGKRNKDIQYFSDETRRITDKAFWNQVADLVTAALAGPIFDDLVNKIRASRGQQIHPDAKLSEVVEVATGRWGATEAEREGIFSRLIEEGDRTKYGLANAITRFSQDVGDYDRATELEAIGAQVYELPQRDWRIIATTGVEAN